MGWCRIVAERYRDRRVRWLPPEPAARRRARSMIVAITPQQWRRLLDGLHMAGLERGLRVGFARDEGAHHTHRAPLDALVDTGVVA